MIPPTDDASAFSAPCFRRSALALALSIFAGSAQCSPEPYAAVGTGAMVARKGATAESQGLRQVVMDRDGDYWLSYTRYADRPLNAGVSVRRFRADGVGLTAPIDVASGATSTHLIDFPSLAEDASGNLAVTWEDCTSPAPNGPFVCNVFARLYDPRGVARGPQFAVDTFASGSQGRPTIAMGADGRFVVVWDSSGEDGSRGGVYGRRFAADGTPAGDEFRVNQATLFDQVLPAVAMDTDGSFVVVFSSATADVDDATIVRYNLLKRRFGADGTPAENDQLVNTITDTRNRFANIAMDDDGDYVIVWHERFQPGDAYEQRFDVAARRYSRSGPLDIQQFPVNDKLESDQLLPSVAMEADGDFTVSWVNYDYLYDGQFGYEVDNRLRRFSAAGVPLTPEISVNSQLYEGFAPNASVAVDADGDAALVDQQRGYDEGKVFVQRFTGGENVDLSVSQQSSGAVPPGGHVDFALRVTNQHAASVIEGVGVANGIHVVQRLQGIGTPMSFDAPGWKCGIDGQVLTCNYSGQLAPGESTTLATGATAGTTAGAFRSTVTVSGSQFDADQALDSTDNSTKTGTTVAADLPILSIPTGPLVINEGGKGTFAVALSAASAQTVTVALGFSGSATAGSDYIAPSQPIVFGPGQTSRTVQVQTLDDANPEDMELAIFALGQPTNAVLADNRKFVLRIRASD